MIAELDTSDANLAISVASAVARITPIMRAKLLPVLALVALALAGESNATTLLF